MILSSKIDNIKTTSKKKSRPQKIMKEKENKKRKK